jgi:hypothetical protein
MSFNPQTAQVNVFEGLEIVVAEETPQLHVERLPKGFQVVECRLPDGRAYPVAQYGVRELALFHRGRADLMDFDMAVDGAVAIGVLTARVWISFKGGGKASRAQYMIGSDGVDHLCRTKAIGEGRIRVYPVKAWGYSTTHNPEAIDKRTGFLKTDYAGKVIRTIQYEMLVSGGQAFAGVSDPVDSYEQGVYLLGAAIQRGGYSALKPQLNKWCVLSAQGRFTNELDGTHFLQLLGHMGQKALDPVAWFVEPQPGYRNLPLAAQRLLSTPFVDPKCCLVAWEAMAAKYKNVGVYLKFAQ